MEPLSVTVAIARQVHPALGRGRIYVAMQSGALQHVRVGKRVCIPLAALNDWVAAGAPVKPKSDNKKLNFTP